MNTRLYHAVTPHRQANGSTLQVADSKHHEILSMGIRPPGGQLRLDWGRLYQLDADAAPDHRRRPLQAA